MAIITVSIATFIPIVTQAASNAVLKTIVPQAGGCPLGYSAFFKMIQNVLTDSLVFAVVVAVLLISYAGFLFVVSPASPDGVSKGRAVLTSTVIGFVIVISAWLIVNELISVFTTGSISSFTALLNPAYSNLCL